MRRKNVVRRRKTYLLKGKVVKCRNGERDDEEIPKDERCDDGLFIAVGAANLNSRPLIRFTNSQSHAADAVQWGRIIYHLAFFIFQGEHFLISNTS